MTVLVPFGRATSKHLISQSNQAFTRLGASSSLLRVQYHRNEHYVERLPLRGSTNRYFSSSLLSYDAPSDVKPVGRPKAHTGRAPAKRTKKPKSTTTTEEGASESKESKPKTAKKTKTKKTKTKAERKSGATTKTPKIKPAKKKKEPSKRALKIQEKTKLDELRAKALLDEPKKLPSNAYVVYFTEYPAHGKGASRSEVQSRFKEMAASYQDITPEERERLNHTANQNKAKNEAAYKKWVESFTPLQIRDANVARQRLSAMKEGKARGPSAIKDDRLVTRPRLPFSYFLAQRFKTGDFRGMKVKEPMVLMAREWKELSASEKKPYEDESKADQARYHEECQTVYGIAPPAPSKKKSESQV